MTARIALGSELLTANFPEHEVGAYTRRWLTAFASRGTSEFIGNAHCQIGAVSAGDVVLPLTITEGDLRDNAYVVSPFTHYVSYLDEELRLVGSRPVRAALAQVVRGLGALLERGQIDRVVAVNNWLLSTNLYPRMTAGELRAMRDALVARFPDHALMFRSLNLRTTSGHFAALRELGFFPLLSRRVHLFDACSPAPFRKKEFRRDHALIAKRGYTVRRLDEVTEGEAERIVALYDALYLDKYSRHNPAFTRAFVMLAVRERLLTVYVLEREGRIDGVVGFFAREGIMTTPLLGYDTTLPRDTGLYRMLTALLSALARERSLFLHRSSGAATFKGSRGAVPELEFSLVYTRHLTLQRRAPWALLRTITERVGRPMLEKYDR